MESKENVKISESSKDEEKLALCLEVFQLKEVNTPIDKYVILFKSQMENENIAQKFLPVSQIPGTALCSIPVMDFEFMNMNYLREALKSPCFYNGFILTSPRAVKAIYLALENFEDKATWLTEWKMKLNYSIGKETASAAENFLGLHTIGHDSGNSVNLVKTIISSLESCSNNRFLFPCSKMKKNTLLLGLRAAGIGMEEIVCYKPVPKSISENWHKVQTAIQMLKLFQVVEKIELIFVFFSPSGVRFILDEFKSLDFNINSCQIIALGPSTQEELKTFGIKASVCDKPTPDGIQRAINALYCGGRS